jgi:signal transduction histidine kinase
LDALAIAEKIDYKKGKGKLYNSIGGVYLYQHKPEQALENYFKYLKIGQETGDTKAISRSYANIAVVYQYQNKYDEALEYYFKSLRINQEFGIKDGICYNMIGIANTYTNQDKHEKAVEYYFKSLALLQEIGHYHPIIGVKRGLAYAYLGLKNYPFAIKYAQEGLQQAKDAGDKTYIKDLHEVFSRIYEASENPAKALFHYKQFKNYSDSLNNLERDKKTATLQAQYEFDKKAAALQAEQFKKDIEQETQRNQLYWIIFSAFLGLVFCFVVLLLIFQSRKKIQKSYNQLEISNAQLLQAKQEIEKQATELQKLNSFKDRLFSIIAHDLRSPMSTLQGTLSILDPEILNKSDLTLIKSELTKQFKVTDKILQDLLQWTKDQLQGEIINPKLFHVNKVVGEKINLFSQTVQQKNISLISEFTEDTEVYADQNHVGIILQNLLSNAIKFTHVGGSIVLKKQRIGEMIEITVKDSGKGMSQYEQDRLFSAEYFTTRGTAGEKGYGLGLQLVKELVEKNGGEIRVASKEGKGSEFSFLLPANHFATRKA